MLLLCRRKVELHEPPRQLYRLLEGLEIQLECSNCMVKGECYVEEEDVK
jgi:hypothetical protein